MKPAEMQKISIAGHRRWLQNSIETLYRLELLDIDSYEGEMDAGSPFEEAEEFSRLQVKTESLLSKLPEVSDREENFRLEGFESRLDRISSRVEELEAEMEKREDQLHDIKQLERIFGGLRGTGITVGDLQGSETVDVLVGDFDAGEVEARLEMERYEILEGRSLDAILFHREGRKDVETAISESGGRILEIPSAPELEGNVGAAAEELQRRKEELSSSLEAIRAEIEEIATEWVPQLRAARDFLDEKVEKAEAPLEFAMTERAFVAEGWVPAEEVDGLESELSVSTDGQVHVEHEEDSGVPPTKYDNRGPVKPFQSLTSLVATPRHDEIDPSLLIFLTFPALFGFMIGDAGYGLTTLAVFYGGYRLVDGAEMIFKSLMWASLFTFIFGLVFGDAFGYVIFGHHSELAAATGIHLFEKIPILFHRAEHLSQVFEISAIFGLVHVNLGFLLGFYNEFTRHGLKEAFLEKISWLVLEIGALGWWAFGYSVGAPVIAIAVVMLYVGEGVEGVVEIPSLLSNVLSYLRIFGVSVAAVALAAVVNSMAEPLFSMGGVAGLAAGTAVLVVGHTFNTFIKIMEGFLQGIRLHYVEFFTKFFDGGGRRYSPFGAK